MRITFFNNVSTAYIDQSNYYDGDWDTIAELLTTYHPDITKDDDHNKSLDKFTMFNLWQFKEVGDGTEGRKNIYKNNERTGDFQPVNGTVRRAKENAVGLWGIVLDFDRIATIDDTVAQLAGQAFALLTSYSHSPDKDKFRVVLPFTRMMPLDEFLLKSDDIAAQYPNADKASFSISQAMYLHSGDPSYARSVVNAGSKIDPDAFTAALVSAPVPNSLTVYDCSKELPTHYQTTVVKSLLSCSGVRRDSGLLLATICKSIGLSEGLFHSICEQISAADSCLRVKAERQNIWRDSGERITAVVRDKFFAAHGGVGYAVSRVGAPPQSESKRQNWKKEQRRLVEKYRSAK